MIRIVQYTTNKPETKVEFIKSLQSDDGILAGSQ